MVAVERAVKTEALRHNWWRPMRVAYVKGDTTPLLDRTVAGLLAHLKHTGHTVLDRPDESTGVLLTAVRFGSVVPWRRSLLLTGRRRYKLHEAPTVFTLVHITPDELGAILARLDVALQKDPPNPADFSFPGLTSRAHRVLIEQGLRGGPMLALVRLLQSQTFSIRVLLLVGTDRIEEAYSMDLVGAHRRVTPSGEADLYEDLARRMATAASTGEVTDHETVSPAIAKAEWAKLSTPQAMQRASVEFGQRGFFTEMVRVADLVDAPALADAVAAQYSEGCFATWEPKIPGLLATGTGSARPVDKGRIQEDELGVIVGVRPDGKGARIRLIEGWPNLPPSSESVEMMLMDQVLPRIALGVAGNGAVEVPVVRSKLHGHRGVAAFDPAAVEFVPLAPPYYEYPVSCGTEAQAQAMTAAFSRAVSLRDPSDPRTIAFTVLPGHGVVLCEKWVEGCAPFEVLWRAMDDERVVIDRLVPQHEVAYTMRSGRMELSPGLRD
jgi:hypothetical protein